jgi:hypothetical protein
MKKMGFLVLCFAVLLALILANLGSASASVVCSQEVEVLSQKNVEKNGVNLSLINSCNSLMLTNKGNNVATNITAKLILNEVELDVSDKLVKNKLEAGNQTYIGLSFLFSQEYANIFKEKQEGAFPLKSQTIRAIVNSAEGAQTEAEIILKAKELLKQGAPIPNSQIIFIIGLILIAVGALLSIKAKNPRFKTTGKILALLGILLILLPFVTTIIV